jgi:hypothetical protein
MSIAEQQLLENIQALEGKIITKFLPSDRIKAAICGDPGTGKSNLIARTCKKPHFHWDFDDRYESIAGIEGVIIKTVFDKSDTAPTAWATFESDIGTLEYLKSQNKLEIKSCAVDSLTFLRKYAEHQLLQDTTASRTKFKIGSTNYLIPKDWDAVTGVQHMLETAFRRLFALGIDVYATFHTRQEKDNNRSTKTEFVYKDSLTVEPPNLKMLLPMFNEKWRTFTEGGKFKVQLRPDAYFNAATVLDNVLDVEDANIQDILKKHFGEK